MDFAFEKLENHKKFNILQFFIFFHEKRKIPYISSKKENFTWILPLKN